MHRTAMTFPMPVADPPHMHSKDVTAAKPATDLFS